MRQLTSNIKVILFIFYCLQLPQVSAQNLLPNPSFEDINICCEYDAPCAPEGWKDVYQNGGNYSNGSRKYPAVSGKHFAIVTLINERGEGMRTYLQAPLICPLKKGDIYTFSMYVRPQFIAVNTIGVYFSDTLICQGSGSFTQNQDIITLTHLKPQIKFQGNQLLKQNKKEWLRLEQDYVASGNERFIIIGNFMPDDSMQWRRIIKKRNMAVAMSKYFIDDVALLPQDSVVDCDYRKNLQLIYADNARHTCNGMIRGCTYWEEILPGLQVETRQIILQDIHFATNSTIIPGDARMMLDSVARQIGQISDIRQILISGHTDSIGGNSANLELSISRAKSVGQYLIAAGLDSRLFEYAGYGSQRPIASNSTEAGRKSNRRVEILIKYGKPSGR